jgi:hypothetical protein
MKRIIGFIGILLVIVLHIESSFAIGSDHLTIEVSTLPSHVEIDHSILISLVLENQGNETISDLRLNIWSAGLEGQNEGLEKPNVIYPNSTIEESFRFKAVSSGEHLIYLDWSYLVNSTSNSNIQQFSDKVNMGKIKITDVPFRIDSSWIPGILSTIIGLAAGTIITMYAENRKAKEIRRNELSELRSILLQVLDRDKKTLTMQRDIEKESLDGLLILIQRGFSFSSFLDNQLAHDFNKLYDELKAIYYLQIGRDEEKTSLMKLQKQSEIDVAITSVIPKITNLESKVANWN